MYNGFARLAAAALSLGMAPQAQAEPLAVIAIIDGRAIAVVDGDSITVDGAEWRLMGFDAAEIATARCEGERRVGLLAQRRLADLIRAAVRDAVPTTLTDSGARDKYRRPLGDLVIGGANVRETMVAEDLARPYNGGLKKGWCSRDSRDDLIPGPLPAREQRLNRQTPVTQ